jgi:hypothetical protein
MPQLSASISSTRPPRLVVVVDYQQRVEHHQAALRTIIVVKKSRDTFHVFIPAMTSCIVIFLDEMDCVPTYHHIVERGNLMCMLSPSNAAMGVNWIKQAAAQGDVAAMIQLGDIHLITFHGDNSVTPSLEKAEKFYCEAYTTTEHPIASFRYATQSFLTTAV